jgi:hypothetical protein
MNKYTNLRKQAQVRKGEAEKEILEAFKIEDGKSVYNV